jgi:hypothetical protein
MLDVRAWRALRASGSAGVLVGAVLMGFGFGAGLWLGRADERPASHLMGQTPASVARVDTFAGGAVPPVLDLRGLVPRDDSASQPDTALHQDIAEPSEPSPPSEPLVRRAARAPRQAPSRAQATFPRAGEELALLRRVERALRTQNPALALALIAELDEHFPDTRLAEERDAARVIATCGVGEGGARIRAERFSREHGGSVYAERVREACGITERSVSSEGSSSSGDQ